MGHLCFAPVQFRTIWFDKIFLKMPGNGIELNGVNNGFYLGIDMLSPFQSHLLKLPVIRLMDVGACFSGV